LKLRRQGIRPAGRPTTVRQRPPRDAVEPGKRLGGNALPAPPCDDEQVRRNSSAIGLSARRSAYARTSAYVERTSRSKDSSQPTTTASMSGSWLGITGRQPLFLPGEARLVSAGFAAGAGELSCEAANGISAHLSPAGLRATHVPSGWGGRPTGVSVSSCPERAISVTQPRAVTYNAGMRPTQTALVIAALFALSLLLSGCGGSNAKAQPKRSALVLPHKPASPSRVPHVIPNLVRPRLIEKPYPNNRQQPGLRCTSRLFAEGRGTGTTVKTCFLSASR
jgi:hypothetical protein